MFLAFRMTTISDSRNYCSNGDIRQPESSLCSHAEKHLRCLLLQLPINVWNKRFSLKKMYAEYDIWYFITNISYPRDRFVHKGGNIIARCHCEFTYTWLLRLSARNIPCRVWVVAKSKIVTNWDLQHSGRQLFMVVSLSMSDLFEIVTHLQVWTLLNWIPRWFQRRPAVVSNNERQA